MASTYPLKDYKTTYFEYKVLDKIHGQPTVDTLLTLFRQLKRNAQCVTCALGGGQLGYLGLILPSAAYDQIPNANPFVRPTNPGPFRLVVDSTNPAPAKRTRAQTVDTASETEDPAVTFTAADIAQQKATHDEALRLFLECQAVEQALRVQIIEAVDAIYLDALRNSDTDMIHEPLPSIMDHLMSNYGQVTLEDMHDKEQDVISMTYDPNTPVDTVFSAVDRFRDLCILTQQPKSDSQLTNIAYIIFNKPRFFMDSLKAWNKQTTNKTYADFKTHLRKEYNELRQVGALTIQDSKLQPQVNIAATQQNLSDQISSTVANDLRNTIMDAIMALNNTDTAPLEPSAPQVNAAAQHTDQVDQLTKLVSELQRDIRQLKPRSTPSSSSTEFNPKTGKPWRRYCHTHGCCNHWGRNCKNKASGHKDDATFRNRMGGNDDNCLPSQT